jgi:hypothetical protein
MDETVIAKRLEERTAEDRRDRDADIKREAELDEALAKVLENRAQHIEPAS